MYQRIARIALVVKDYDEAIEFYTKQLEFELLEDTPLEDGKRWVLVAPKGGKDCALILTKAENEEELNCIGNQAGGRVVLYLFTDDFWRDFNKMKDKNIRIVREPKEEVFGTVAIFADLYGNLWDLIQEK